MSIKGEVCDAPDCSHTFQRGEKPVRISEDIYFCEKCWLKYKLILVRALIEIGFIKVEKNPEVKKNE